MRLSGKAAIITGGGRDIGRACALALAADGADVAINYHSSAEGAEATVAAIKQAGGRAFAMRGDLTRPEDAQALADAATEAFGGIHVLVNNTGGLIARKTIAEMEPEHWNAVLALNVTSAFLMTRACLRHMTAGAIVNIASQAGRDGGGGGAVAYGASKGAVMTMTRGLAKELGPDIRVNALCPGMIDTDFHNTFTPDEVRAKVAGATPMRREGTSEDVARLVAFLAGPDAAFMTGTNVDINGGTLFS